jgi:hypothetical protein
MIAAAVSATPIVQACSTATASPMKGKSRSMRLCRVMDQRSSSGFSRSTAKTAAIVTRVSAPITVLRLRLRCSVAQRVTPVISANVAYVP